MKTVKTIGTFIIILITIVLACSCGGREYRPFDQGVKAIQAHDLYEIQTTAIIDSALNDLAQ